MSKVQAVLFDAVGTLFGVRGSVGSIYSVVAADFGVHLSAEALDSRFLQAYRGRRAPVADSRAWWADLVRTAFEGCTFTDFEAFFERVWQVFATAAAWELFPETLEVVTALTSQGIALAVVSNFDERLHRVLEALELATFFPVVVTSAEVGYAKPDPRIFAVALMRLGVPSERACHIGDASEDVAGAAAANIPVLRVDRSGKPLSGSVPSLRSVLEILG